MNEQRNNSKKNKKKLITLFTSLNISHSWFMALIIMTSHTISVFKLDYLLDFQANLNSNNHKTQNNKNGKGNKIG